MVFDMNVRTNFIPYPFSVVSKDLVFHFSHYVEYQYCHSIDLLSGVQFE